MTPFPSRYCYCTWVPRHSSCVFFVPTPRGMQNPRRSHRSWLVLGLQVQPLPLLPQAPLCVVKCGWWVRWGRRGTRVWRRGGFLRRPRLFLKKRLPSFGLMIGPGKRLGVAPSLFDTRATTPGQGAATSSPSLAPALGPCRKRKGRVCYCILSTLGTLHSPSILQSLASGAAGAAPMMDSVPVPPPGLPSQRQETMRAPLCGAVARVPA